MGYPHVASRRLDVMEGAQLERERRRQLLEVAAVSLAPLLLPVLLGITAAAVGIRADVAAVIGAACFVFGTAAALLRARDLVVRRRWTAKDIARGLVLEFARPDAMDSNSPLVSTSPSAAWEASPDPREEPPITVRFEILAQSGRLWTSDGQRVRGYQRLPVARVVELPRHAQIAAQWVRPVPLAMPEAQRLHAGTRPLSNQELVELRRHERRAWRSRVLPIGIWVAFVCLAIGNAVIDHVTNFQSFAAAVLGLAFILRLVQNLRLAWGFHRDVEVGLVEIYRIESDPETLSPALELLPVSRIPWSEGGVPAIWRSVIGKAVSVS